MSASLDPGLVLLSISIAAIAAYSALSTTERLQNVQTRSARRVWFGFGSVAMGAGIWTMHFVGMLAYEMPMQVHYDVAITALSIVPGILASAIALHMLRRPEPSWLKLNAGGLLMGAGIGAMHYTGMAAMVMPGLTVYDPTLFAVSILVAHGLATFALAARFRILRHTRATTRNGLVSAILMGCAVAGMHYTAMLASYHLPDPERAMATTSPVVDSFQLATAVSVVTGLLLGLSIIAGMVDRRIQGINLALLASRERTRVLLDTIAEGIVGFDAHGTMTTCNQAAADIFAVEPAQMIGRSFYDRLADADVEAIRVIIATYGQSNTKDLNRYREVEGRRPDGTCFPLQLAISYYEHDGEASFAAILRDLSDQQELEARLLQSQKLESIGQLAAGIAHEINTPAQFVGDNLEFIEDSVTDLGPIFDKLTELTADGDERIEIGPLREATEQADVEFLRKELPLAVSQSRDGVARIAEIVRAMKDFSHPGAEGFQSIDLNRALESTATVARNEWKYVAEIAFDLDASLPPVTCHAGEINQCVLNILVNAAHAIGDRREESDPLGHICIRTRNEGDHALIEIQDDGGGIPESAQSKVFDPFFTTKGVGRGTGQGLSIAYASIVDRHQGSLDFTVEPDVGTTFHIRLPLDGRANPEGTTPEETSA